MFTFCGLVFSHQARDDVITVLKSEATDSALLEAHYGFSGLEKVLNALRRDSLQMQNDQLQDVCTKPTAEVQTANNQELPTIWRG